MFFGFAAVLGCLFAINHERSDASSQLVDLAADADARTTAFSTAAHSYPATLTYSASGGRSDNPFEYPVRVNRIIDGDTVVMDFPLPIALPESSLPPDKDEEYAGLGVWLIRARGPPTSSICMILRNEPVRLLGINAPEVGGHARSAAEKKRGDAATAYLASQIKSARRIDVRTDRDKRDKYGRILVTIFTDGKNLNQAMLDTGNAIAVDW